MIRTDDVVFHDERAQLYDAFMSDVLEIGGNIGSVAVIGRLLRLALEGECDRRQWAALDRRLASLLARTARDRHSPAMSRLYSYLRENQHGS